MSADNPGAVRTPPRSRPPVVLPAVLVALVLVALGVVAVRDLVVDQGWAAGTPWTPQLVDSLDGTSASVGLLVVGAVVAVIGLLVVVAALRPGRRTHVPTFADADLWISPRALASLAARAADRAPGVVSAQPARTGRRKIVVEVVTHQEGATVTEAARSAVAAGPGTLTSVTIDVRVQEVGR